MVDKSIVDYTEFDTANEADLSVSYDTERSAVPARVYEFVFAAYNSFNIQLFDDRLPPCLLTMQRRRSSMGHFSGGRFVNVADPRHILDEIALNPAWLTEDVSEALGTLANEMVHCWQHAFGKGSRSRYHNLQWAAKMVEIGLQPSDTGKPDGKATGDRVSHYIRVDGPFDLACKQFLRSNTAILFKDRHLQSEEGDKLHKRRKRQAASKTRFTCGCCQANAWGKPELKLLCQPCDEAMMPVEPDPFEDNSVTSPE